MNNYLIIGASAAGIGAMSSILRVEPDANITIISDEPYLPYNKCYLIDYLSQHKTLDQVYTRTADFFEQHKNVQLMHAQVINVDTQHQKVILSTGVQFSYNALCIATGSRARTIAIPGINARGVFNFHTLADTHALEEYLKLYEVKRAIILGAGFTGLEAADALAKKGIDVTVVDRQERVLSNVLSDVGSLFIQQHMHHNNVSFRAHASIASIKEKNGVVCAIECADGKIIPTDLVIVALGVQPNAELAQQAGIVTNTMGIAVDDYLQTSAPNVWAAGDVVVVPNVITKQLMRSCMWRDAVAQGTLAGKNMTGLSQPYPGIALWATSHFFDLDVMIAGSVQQVEYLMTEQTYRAWHLDNGRLIGFALLGSQNNVSELKRLYMSGAPCDRGMIEQIMAK